MASRGLVPAMILSSPAVRAEQTAALVKTHSGSDAPLHFDERIYEASALALRQVLSELADSIDSVMIVGHNPGMEGLIRLLSGVIEAMPTAALAVIELRIDSWQELGSGSGLLLSVYRPKEEAKKTSTN